MSSNCLFVITKALKRIGVIAAGELPTQDQQDDALDMLRAMYRRLITDGAFGVITEITPTSSPIDACPNTRLTLEAGFENAVVNLPETAPDGSLIIVCALPVASMDELIFDGQTRDWINISKLQLTSTAPLAHRDLIGLSSALALELAPEYGQAALVDDETRRNAIRFHSGLIYNWSASPDDSGGWRNFF